MDGPSMSASAARSADATGPTAVINTSAVIENTSAVIESREPEVRVVIESPRCNAGAAACALAFTRIPTPDLPPIVGHRTHYRRICGWPLSACHRKSCGTTQPAAKDL